MEANRRIARPRLYHTKSKTGCTRCRARRVKCNEAKPVCNNCHRHSVPCHYDRAPVPRKDEEGPVKAAEPAEPTTDRVHETYWELRAFHHFAVATSQTLSGSHIPSVRDCWSRQVPIMALSYKPLWNQLLALSALHLISSGTDDARLLASRAAFLEATLQSYRPALEHLGPETAEAACFTSILLMVDTFASLQARPINNNYEPPMQWLRVTQGTRAVFEAADIGPGSSIMTIITTFDHNLDADNKGRRFKHLLDQFPGETRSAETATLAAYQETIARLDMIQAAVESGKQQLALCRRFMSFPCLVPPLFVELVEQKAPRALVILGHFFALAASVSDLWWVGETPFREAHAIRVHLLPELDRFMNWPSHVQPKA